MNTKQVAFEVGDNLNGVHRTGTLNMPYPELVELLGEAPSGPSDDGKADVEWEVKSKENPSIRIGIWNFKNGPAYCGAGKTLESIDSFSLWAETQEQKEFAKELFGNKVEF